MHSDRFWARVTGLQFSPSAMRFLMKRISEEQIAVLSPQSVEMICEMFPADMKPWIKNMWFQLLFIDIRALLDLRLDQQEFAARLYCLISVYQQRITLSTEGAGTLQDLWMKLQHVGLGEEEISFLKEYFGGVYTSSIYQKLTSDHATKIRILIAMLKQSQEIVLLLGVELLTAFLEGFEGNYQPVERFTRTQEFLQKAKEMFEANPPFKSSEIRNRMELEIAKQNPSQWLFHMGFTPSQVTLILELRKSFSEPS